MSKFRRGSLLLSLSVACLLGFQNCGGFSSDHFANSPAHPVAGNLALYPQDAATDPGYDIFVIAGQSNAVGYGCGNHTDVSTGDDARIFQVDPTGNVIPASDPLFFNTEHVNLVGFGMTFARLYAQKLPANRKVLLVPAAKGGTSIVQWDNYNEGIELAPSNGLVEDSTQLWDQMVSRTQVALAYQGQHNRIVALLWHQGENDYSAIKGTSSTWSVMHTWIPTVAAYQTRLQSFFNLFRAEFAGGQPLPIVAGAIGAFWSTDGDPDPGSQILLAFNGGSAAVVAGLPNATFVSADGLISDALDGCSTDSYHFSASSQVELGKRYFAQFVALSAVTSSALTPIASPPPKAPITYGEILANVPISCDYFNPDAIKRLSSETILWLASLQPSGLTLHENYYVARGQGYNGAFGHGEHSQWLAGDPGRLAAFNAAEQNVAQAPLPPWTSFAAHHIAQRASGYQGLFLCGGSACYFAGQCDSLGRRL